GGGDRAGVRVRAGPVRRGGAGDGGVPGGDVLGPGFPGLVGSAARAGGGGESGADAADQFSSPAPPPRDSRLARGSADRIRAPAGRGRGGLRVRRGTLPPRSAPPGLGCRVSEGGPTPDTRPLMPGT